MNIAYTNFIAQTQGHLHNLYNCDDYLDQELFEM